VYVGRLGHATAENVRTPKMIEALGGKDIKMVRILGPSFFSCLRVFWGNQHFLKRFTIHAV